MDSYFDQKTYTGTRVEAVAVDWSASVLFSSMPILLYTYRGKGCSCRMRMIDDFSVGRIWTFKSRRPLVSDWFSAAFAVSISPYRGFVFAPTLQIFLG
jgi:putative flippase GtrA